MKNECCDESDVNVKSDKVALRPVYVDPNSLRLVTLREVFEEGYLMAGRTDGHVDTEPGSAAAREVILSPIVQGVTGPPTLNLAFSDPHINLQINHLRSAIWSIEMVGVLRIDFAF